MGEDRPCDERFPVACADGCDELAIACVLTQLPVLLSMESNMLLVVNLCLAWRCFTVSLKAAWRPFGRKWASTSGIVRDMSSTLSGRLAEELLY